VCSVSIHYRQSRQIIFHFYLCWYLICFVESGEWLGETTRHAEEKKLLGVLFKAKVTYLVEVTNTLRLLFSLPCVTSTVIVNERWAGLFFLNKSPLTLSITFRHKGSSVWIRGLTQHPSSFSPFQISVVYQGNINPRGSSVGVSDLISTQKCLAQ
jgi:hypothetical protein